MSADRFQQGDWVIYRKTKHSTHPGPRAENVVPAAHGDEYAYTVDKFWIVSGVQEDGSLVLETRRGKQHVVRPDDPNLCAPNWWQRWRYRSRFPARETVTQETSKQQTSKQETSKQETSKQETPKQETSKQETS